MKEFGKHGLGYKLGTDAADLALASAANLALASAANWASASSAILARISGSDNIMLTFCMKGEFQP